LPLLVNSEPLLMIGLSHRLLVRVNIHFNTGNVSWSLPVHYHLFKDWIYLEQVILETPPRGPSNQEVLKTGDCLVIVQALDTLRFLTCLGVC
jgi:hypothetical protein